MEAEARAALRAFVAVDAVERWIAGQPWQTEARGWTVLGEFHGHRFRVEPAPGGFRVTASADAASPAVWIVPAR